ncbi:chlororespiratory reduction protein 7 [Prochlorococcus sp. MIT 1341]|uniref:chlororespiratory reduction protein 7 n=1 Tax=Prochlorococcus sp. MIT 1341 TaxID=3096221 RepID=UPI002A75A880|nr:chlororespiratory reduction protein 7 [Prochlorococcus sp. MIT 1341]
MSNPLIRKCDYYLVLEPLKAEKILTLQETLDWLQKWLGEIDDWPDDLKTESSMDSAAKRLLDTACELEIQPGFSLQWFAVRIDHEDS